MTVLSIQSEVVAGHVGNSAARFALQRLGHDVLALPTVLFSNHPGHGGFSGRAVPPDDLAALVEGLAARGFLGRVRAVVTGYLGQAGQAEVAADAIRRVRRVNPAALVLVDPVFGDEGGAYAAPGVAEAIARQLLPLADIVMPNRFELASLTARQPADPQGAVAAARLLGRPLVVATSIPDGGMLATLAVTPGEAWIVRVPRQPVAPSGTGDLIAALFLGHRLDGAAVPEALARAAATVDVMIRAAGEAKDMPLVGAQAAITAPPALAVSRFGD